MKKGPTDRKLHKGVEYGAWCSSILSLREQWCKYERQRSLQGAKWADSQQKHVEKRLAYILDNPVKP